MVICSDVPNNELATGEPHHHVKVGLLLLVKVLNFKAKPHGVLSTQVGDLLNLLVKRVAHPGTKLT